MSRSAWLPHALRCFAAQDYENRELIVASEDAEVATLLPDDPRIRFVVTPSGLALGAKRDAVNEAAHGTWIAHWDDDDWYAPRRLTVQLQALRARRCIAGAKDLLFVDLANGAFWRYQAPPDEPSACGATLCYPRDVWEAYRFGGGAQFGGAQSGEERRWCLAHKLPIAEPTEIVAVASAHARNTCRRQFAAPCWTRVDGELLPAACRTWIGAVRRLG